MCSSYKEMTMTDLTTTYMGLKLKNPIIAAASPLSKKAELVRRLEDSGAGAVVMYSLFEEEITHESNALDYFLNRGTDSFSEFSSFFPDWEKYGMGPDNYLDQVQKLKSTVDIPIIGSLNGVTSGGWVDYASKIEQAGADALELNIYYLPTDANLNSEKIEKSYLDLVGDVHARIRIPLAIKLSPSFTALPHLASRLAKAGAGGLVLFNRFLQPDLDIDTLEVVPHMKLSTSADMLLPLRWTAILYGKLKTDLAFSGGVHSGRDAIKALMAGASAVQMASELLEKGPERVGEILTEMSSWMDSYEYRSVEQMRGCMSQQSAAHPDLFERANYTKALVSYDKRLIF
jgi:dihydroorotate dehydrogenase (fumarate)